jgi:hypothetical protein
VGRLAAAAALVLLPQLIATLLQPPIQPVHRRPRPLRAAAAAGVPLLSRHW